MARHTHTESSKLLAMGVANSSRPHNSTANAGRNSNTLSIANALSMRQFGRRGESRRSDLYDLEHVDSEEGGNGFSEERLDGVLFEEDRSV